MLAMALLSAALLAAARPRATAVVPVSSSWAVRLARAVSLSRDTPSGTLGGRKQPTDTPSNRSSVAISAASAADPTGTDCTAPADGATPQRCAKTSALRSSAAASPGSSRTMAAARAPAAAAAGANAVSKMNVRAVFTRCSRNSVDPSTAPPWEPSALDKVAVAATWADPANPAAATAPRPPPATPIPCASSTKSRASYVAHSAAAAARSAASPKTE